MKERAEHLARGILENQMFSSVQDLDGKPIRTIAISAKNCADWMVFDVACCISGLTSVTLYDTLGKESTGYILNQCEIKTVFCEAKQIKELVELKQAGEINHLEYLVVINDVAEIKDIKFAESAGLHVLTFENVEHGGFKSQIDLPSPQPDSVFTICYTSGTTGFPKGAMISHKNVLVMANGLRVLGIDFNEDDVHLSYLTLAHIFERVVS